MNTNKPQHQLKHRIIMMNASSREMLYFEEYQQLNHPKQILFFTSQPFFPHLKKYFFHSITE